MMRFWTNFAKTGQPGNSTNSITWMPFEYSEGSSNYLVLDKKKNLGMKNEELSYKSLVGQIINDNRLSELEKCVVLFQMFTYVGDDIYNQNMENYPGKCNRNDSIRFLKENASFIEY